MRLTVHSASVYQPLVQAEPRRDNRRARREIGHRQFRSGDMDGQSANRAGMTQKPDRGRNRVRGTYGTRSRLCWLRKILQADRGPRG